MTPTIDPINPPMTVHSDRNAYDFRLVVSRKLYDAGVTTRNSPSLAPLAGVTRLYVNPLDVARIGSVEGHEIKVTSSRAMVILTLATDPSVHRGTAWVPFNQPGRTRIGDLIDTNAAITDIRIETL